MELSKEQLESIIQASREIEFGQIKITFLGASNQEIAIEKRVRFHNGIISEPSVCDPTDNRNGTERTVKGRWSN